MNTRFAAITVAVAMVVHVAAFGILSMAGVDVLSGLLVAAACALFVAYLAGPSIRRHTSFRASSRPDATTPPEE